MPESMRRLLLQLGLLSCLLGWTGLGVAATKPPLHLVVTTGMLADAVREVGGERVEVKALMGSGIDPHTYRQTRSDIAAMTRADAVFWHGLYLEAQLEDFFSQLGKRKTVVALAERLPRGQLLASEEYPDRFDPHVWMDPELWQGVVQSAADALAALEPESEALFRANAERYRQQIATLQAYAHKVLGSVPESARVLVTAHDAFNYFGRAYGYEVMGIQGISTESEAGLHQVEHLVRLLVERRIAAVFVESSVSERNVRALVEGAARQGWSVRIGGELFSDAMGRPGSYEGTYIGMLDHNLTTIARALGGDAPESGMQGNLEEAR